MTFNDDMEIVDERTREPKRRKRNQVVSTPVMNASAVTEADEDMVAAPVLLLHLLLLG